jgi:hypothetical protein
MTTNTKLDTACLEFLDFATACEARMKPHETWGEKGFPYKCPEEAEYIAFMTPRLDVCKHPMIKFICAAHKDRLITLSALHGRLFVCTHCLLEDIKNPCKVEVSRIESL